MIHNQSRISGLHIFIYKQKHVSESDNGTKLTLIFDDIVPLVSDAFGSFLGGFGGENKEALVLLDHVIDGGPVGSILGHSRQWEQVLGQPRGVEHLGEPIGGCHVVFNEYGHNF